MALFLKISNSLESLAAALAQSLAFADGRVFEPNYIVTQTDGMNNWLKWQLATRLGISANNRFMKPNDFVRQLYFLLNGPFTETLSRETLTWLLFRLLAEEEFIRRFPAIAEYYQQERSTADVRRMGLAEKTADLFDQYQIYRPTMIQEWNSQTLDAIPALDWQQWLWVRARIDAGEAMPDKSGLSAYILEALRARSQQEVLVRRIPVVHLFGLSILTAYHIQLLYELSTVIDVRFHLVNPAPSIYWLEDKGEKQLAIWKRKGMDITGFGAGNPLLTSWGKVIQDTLSMLFQHDEFLNAYEETAIAEPKPDSLLHKIQLDIFSATSANRQPLNDRDIRDGSITINSCFTVAREVEALYNFLVHLVDKGRVALSPREIVVMVSDIDSYAPYIKAVFNNAPYPFPYTIADESYSDGDNLFTAIRTLLVLNEENFTSEAVLQLLDSSLIRSRFGIEDLDRIREVVDAASIRFGMEGSRLDDTDLVSWVNGLRRIMYGICMSGGERYGSGYDAFYPVDIVEGGEALAIIRFCHFVEACMESIWQRKVDRPIAQWVTYIENLVQNLIFEPGDEPDEHYELLVRQLSGLNVACGYMPGPVTFDVFAHSLLSSLDSSCRSGLFAGGGITFCSLIPMRSIPFRVVAMIGLNYDNFPRRETPVSFDLIARTPQRGDRNIKENDKHLFLETLLSTREYLYLSYQGQNPQDNAVLPPSALIDELVDYIEAGAETPEKVRDGLITIQPLQGFSRRYEAGSDRLYSYLKNSRAAIAPRTIADKQVEELKFEEIQLEDVLRFFRNPFKTYYNKVLGIYYDEDSTLLAETELFGLDQLQRWSLKQLLLPAAGPADIEEQLLKTGQLPLKNMGTVLLREIDEQVAPVRDLFREYTRDREGQLLPLGLQMGESLLTGTLEPVFDGRLLQVCWSKDPTKHLTDAYIRYLAGAAAGHLSGLSFLLAAETPALYEAEPLSTGEASKRLGELLAVYKQGFQKIAPWFPTFRVKPEQLDSLTIDDFLQMVGAKLTGGLWPCDDPYILPEYRYGYFNREGVTESFKAIYIKIFVPLAELFPGLQRDKKI
ncbi:MAG TPA: exodeoxyribonuclease V subunit gamma [Puia sp.]|nr:exodeoxyribonuclease V subunit gamma [Puia sp.]